MLPSSSGRRSPSEIEYRLPPHHVEVNTIGSNLVSPRRLDKRRPQLLAFERPRGKLQLSGHYDYIVVAFPSPESGIRRVLPKSPSASEIVGQQPRSRPDEKEVSFRDQERAWVESGFRTWIEPLRDEHIRPLA